ncbi:conjugal transfer protein TraI [Flavobacterium psychrolimnae]|uniref:Conjugal transfer protein TraI n=1 Tax=Flavobacterium psychrolimnae TaxID=249351 RepID=A0A366AYG6_9FLAO|nr:conjugal transfer protein TraI [Flavobacterium psychrolimnae]RBN49453.1 conjugal transfer protein TraI [Flavobacterium psychrolimnae]
MKAKKNMMVGLLCLLLLSIPARPATTVAAVPLIGLIKDAVAAVIKAIDLRIQRLQNKTIWLQNAQKKLENVLSKVKLDEISNWTQKQKELYKGYYDELAKVKSIITYYQRIRDITQKQVRLVAEYERAWKLFQRDDHFKADELAYMQKVYSGILNESMNNIDQIFSVVESFTMQMSDAKRLEIINTAADQIDATYDDLSQFNRQNIQLSLQRAKSNNDVNAIKKFYGIPN